MKDINTGIKVSSVSSDDHPELEGKFINFISRTGGEYPAVVVGCNRSVGITIVDANNKDRYLMCYRGPACPGYKDLVKIKNEDQVLDTIIQGIIDDEVNMGDVYAASKDPGYATLGSNGPGPSNCAYNQ